jgi:flagellin-like hook-associated protein FlgL
VFLIHLKNYLSFKFNYHEKKITLFLLMTSLFGVSQVFGQTNLLAGLWDGNGITGELSKPNDVGWTNSVTASIPWTVANGSGGARFRDYNVTGGHTGFTNESDGSTSETRQLMFRWDNASYSASYYGYPVVLEAGKYYKFSFDYVLGGSGTPPNTITVGISTTVNGADRLSSKTFTTTSSSTVYRSGTYDFNVPTNGTYYITFNSAAAVWYGVTKLSITEITQADKTALLAQLNIANGMVADPQPVGTSTVYTELNNVIATAQAVYDNINASVAQVLAQENALKAAIAAVNSAVVLYQRISTWTTLP